MDDMKVNLTGKKVLVTGGTGFIGGRLVERLILESKADVRVLVRNFSNASRIARFAVEMAPGDVTNLKDIENAVSGCEIVFHCAYCNQGPDEMRQRLNLKSVENIMGASLRAGVKRVVYLSSQMVYGIPPEGDLDETSPRRYSKVFGGYSSIKLDTEKYVFEYCKNNGLPVTIIQPTGVYGPYAPGWTLQVIKMLKTGRVILINGGDGLFNAVYIDDAISAILLAAVKKDAIGEAFLISGEEPITWREFFERYEKMLGTSATINMSETEAKSYYYKSRKRRGIIGESLDLLREKDIRRRILQTSEMWILRRFFDLLVPGQLRQALKERLKAENRDTESDKLPNKLKPIHPVDPETIKFYTMKTTVRIDKAKRILGYQPAYDFDSGMKLTEQWYRWFNLLN